MIHNQNRRTLFFKFQNRASKRLRSFRIEIGAGLVEDKRLWS